MDKILFLSGTTRGATLEGVGRSLAHHFRELGVEQVEISLLQPQPKIVEILQKLNPAQIRFAYSWVGMGMEFTVHDPHRPQPFNLWQALRIPFLTIHGDSPAYFFDRHVSPSPNFVHLYSFDEHRRLRTRLPLRNTATYTVNSVIIDAVDPGAIDWKARRDGPLLFLKNGKDPQALRQMWTAGLDAFLLHSILALADDLENHLDDGRCEDIDAVVCRYFADRGFEIETMIKLRLFFAAQLDDYIRAYKCSLLAEALKELPVEIRGNNWHHIDFTGARATCIDECNYQKSTGLLRGALATIDMAPNVTSRPHDRILRAYGAHGLCLTNQQQWTEALPHHERFCYRYQKESIQQVVGWALEHRDEVLEIGKEVSLSYHTQNPVRENLQKMLDWASLARLDQMRQRPDGAQDFFCWPPSALTVD